MTSSDALFHNPTFDFLTRIALGSAACRLAEVGEVLATIGEIDDGDMESWYDAWMATAARVERIAHEAEAGGRAQTARDAHLRAAMYIGTAFFNILGTSHAGDKVAVWERHRENAEAAFRLWPTPVEKVAIPYEGTALEGYFFSAGEGRRPLLIFNNGSDGTVVETLCFGLDEAVRRGYHALAFDGPGQGQALYLQGLCFRHDSERVITPVVDWATGRDDVDPRRIALHGCSQAGYWVPRAAAFEKRLAAAIVDPGVVDVATSWLAHLPQQLIELHRAGDRASFEAAIEQDGEDPATRAIGAKRMEPFGRDSLFDVLTELELYKLAGVAGRVECPVLILDNQGEDFWPGQSERLYDLLDCPKTLIELTAVEGAGGHCEPLAPILRSHRVLDWLDATLGAACEDRVDGAGASAVKTGGVTMVPIDGGYHVWTKRLGSGPARMLTLHGGPGCTHEYLECFEDFLPQAGIQFHYYDQLGSGHSDQPDDPSLWTVERFRDEVEQVRDALGLDRFYLYGQSWGALLAIEYALEHQHNLKGLVLSNMTASFPSYVSHLAELRRELEPDLLRVMEQHEAAGDYDAPEYVEIMYRHIYTKHVCRVQPWPEPLRRMFSHMSSQVYNTMQGANEFVVTGNLADWDRWADLHRIDVPTLISVGRFDTMRVADIERMGELMPDARVSICERGSHCSMYDDQETYFRELLRFVADVEAGSAAGPVSAVDAAPRRVDEVGRRIS